MPSVAEIIRRRARKYGVDPRAAIAVARGEGGLRYGAVGDQGTSYGPFQLHEGGALPRGRGAAWANSPSGIDYALRKMSESGARGLTGKAAVSSIVRNFERPADPDSSVRNAMGRYGSSAGVEADSPAPARIRSSSSRGSGNLASALLSYAQSGGKGSQELYKALARPRSELVSSSQPSEVDIPGRNGVAQGRGHDGAVSAAASQLGKPYVFGSGPDTSSFDCSDLVQWSYKQMGIDIPRDTVGQMKVLPRKAWKDLKPGDPIYRNSGGHVVMYAGNGRVLAAPRTGEVVQYQPLSNFTGGDYHVRSIR